MNAPCETSPAIVSEALVAVIQVGTTGVWGRFSTTAEAGIKVDDWVVCQTGRGLEIGRVRLLLTAADGGAQEDIVGPILRVATESDLLTRQRIERAAPAGIDACNRWLGDNGFSQIVLDVDVPLDGQRLYFHFLGDVDRSLEAVTESLVELFDQTAGIRRFTQAVITGCGPQCGSDGTGCGSGGGAPSNPADGRVASGKSGCGSCALNGGCGKR
jgi:hypothetical protein